MMNDELTKIMADYQYMPLRDLVFHTLRRAILQGYLKPGERLMEIKLANRMGVSRTPIREAIRMLELEGLVVMIPRKGAQVAKITEKDLREVLEVRMGLEQLAVQFAVQRITDDQVEALYRASRQFEQSVKKDDLTEIAEADVHFHELLYEATGNTRLVQLLNNLREQMYRYRIEYLKGDAVRESLVKEHDIICEKLKARDMEGARAIIESHIERQEESILHSLQTIDQ